MGTNKIALLITIVVLCAASICQAQEKKSLEAKIAELEAQQRGSHVVGKTRDTKITSLESKLVALEAKLKSQQNEPKVITLENQSKSAQVAGSMQPNRSDAVTKLDLSTQTIAAAPKCTIHTIMPVALNFMDTTALSPQESDRSGSEVVYNFWKCASPTNGFWGLNDHLAPSGIELGLGLTSLYQTNVKGGTSTTQRRGRHVSRYDLEMSMDLEKLLGIEGGSFFLHGWGGWPDTEGVDGHSVGSAWGTNALAVGNRGLDIVEAFYEGPLFSDNLTIAIGKLDFTGIFDASEYADDECCQFLNAALVDNPTIPFPALGGQGLGVVLNWSITDSWYLMGGVVDAQADGREIGYRTAFHDQDYYFYALETGITAGNGNYRLGIWNDPQPKTNSDGTKNKRDDIGAYTSCDWLVYEENPGTEDSQGLGVFARYGYAPSNKNDVTNFFSAGLHYQGLIDGRDDDICGLAYARGVFADTADSTYTEDYESVIEAYYNAQITPWFNLSPNIQFVKNAGGSNTAKDAIIVGLRSAITF